MRRQPAAQSVLEVFVRNLRLDHVFEEVLGDVDVLGPLGDERAGDPEFRRHRLARVVEGKAHGHDVVVFLFLMEQRDLGGDRSVEIHEHLLGVERVVVVGVAPAQRAGRHVAFLERGGDVG